MGREVPEDYKQYNPILRKLNHSPRKLNKLLIYPYGFFFLILSKDMMNTKFRMLLTPGEVGLGWGRGTQVQVLR